ncbi:MAG: hypothetical protein ACI4SO_06535 [Muribaculaceae bacterium]
MVPQPSLYKARYQGDTAYHRVRSRRDLNPALIITRHLRSRTPRCLRHIGVPRLEKQDGEVIDTIRRDSPSHEIG